MADAKEAGREFLLEKLADDQRRQEAERTAKAMGVPLEDMERATAKIAANMKRAEEAAERAADAARRQARLQIEREREQENKDRQRTRDANIATAESVGMNLANRAGAFGRGAFNLYEYSQGRGGGIGGAVASFARQRAEQAGMGSTGSAAMGVLGGVAGGVAGAGISMGTWAIGKAFEPLMAIWNEISAKLDPLNVIREALAAPNSGTGVFASSIKLLGTMLGTLVLPAFAVLTSSVIAYTFILNDQLMPTLIELATDIVPALAIALEMLLDATVMTWSGLKNLYDGAKGEGIGGTVLSAMGITPVVQDLFKTYDTMKRDGAKPIGPNGQAEDTRKRMSDGLNLFAAELRFQLTPKASVMGIADASRQAQLAAFNVSPMERETLKIQADSLVVLEQIRDGLPGPPTTH